MVCSYFLQTPSRDTNNLPGLSPDRATLTRFSFFLASWSIITYLLSTIFNASSLSGDLISTWPVLALLAATFLPRQSLASAPAPRGQSHSVLLAVTCGIALIFVNRVILLKVWPSLSFDDYHARFEALLVGNKSALYAVWILGVSFFIAMLYTSWRRTWPASGAVGLLSAVALFFIAPHVSGPLQGNTDRSLEASQQPNIPTTAPPAPVLPPPAPNPVPPPPAPFVLPAPTPGQ